MAGTFQVRCINKSDRDNPWERITHLGGLAGQEPWRITQERCIAGIEADEKYFVKVNADPDTVWLVVATSRYGNKYVKTQSDGDQPNNLLKLPECPKT